MQVVPTDFARYRSNGTGYIAGNNGGLASNHQNHELSLRDGTHRPTHLILLPSYSTHTAVGSQSARSSSLSPRKAVAPSAAQLSQADTAARRGREQSMARTARLHQRQVSELLHSARSSSNTQGKTARAAVHAAAAAAEAARTGQLLPMASRSAPFMPYGHVPIPSWPAHVPRDNSFARSSGYGQGRTSTRKQQYSLSALGSASARLPAQFKATQQQQQTQAQNGSHAQQISQQQQSRPEPPALPQQPAGAFQQTLAANFAASEAAAQARAELRDSPHAQPRRAHIDIFAGSDIHTSTPKAGSTTSASSLSATTAAPATTLPAASPSSPAATTSSPARYIPPRVASYAVTLPKHSAYALSVTRGFGSGDDGQTHRPPHPNYNALPSAGFSAKEKMRSRGIEEQGSIFC